MYQSTVKQALVRQPLLLGLERRAMIFGAMITIACVASRDIYVMIAGITFACAYWGIMLRVTERDTQFFSAWLRSIEMKDDYLSYRRRS